MDSNLSRALVALALAALLWAQARASGDRPHRRRAYQLAAGALLAFAASNAAAAAGLDSGPLTLAVVVIGVALLAVAAVSLVRSMYAGEMRSQRDQIAAAAEEFKERQKAKDQRR